MKILIRNVGVLLIAGILAWRVIVNGLADHYAIQETPETDTGALRWRDDHPMALYRQGQSLIQSDSVAAEASLRSAILGNPTNALAYLALADVWSKAERHDAATKLVTIADTLGPLQSPALARSAAFWVQHNRIDLALARWSMLLRTRPENASKLYPILLQLAEDPATQPLLQPSLDNPPEWWDGFFAYAAANTTRAQTVTFLYQGHNRKGELPTANEQRVYLNWLLKEKRWLEMYFAWLGGLDKQQQQGLGNLYNGSFELPISNVGFDWRTVPSRGATLEALETYDTHGAKALRISFNGERLHFRHLSQFLYLESGRYLLRGRARLDSLRTERGLRWKLMCMGENSTLLAESEPFVGSETWRDFKVDFTVPSQGCPAQLIRLELEGRAELDFQAKGDVWFDNLAISRQE